MCSVTTVGEYIEKKKWLDEIVNISQILLHGQIWDAREVSHVSAFRHFGHSMSHC